MTQADDDRCAEYERFMRVHAAFQAGDLEALREAVDDPDAIPNGVMPPAIGPCLEYAVYHSPLAFIRRLLEIGADPNPTEHAGFPPLIAALSCSQPQPGSPGRSDVIDIIRMLLEFGSDPNQRGLNDWTPLHAAVGYGNLAALEVLVEGGADPHLRTRIDDCATAREEAARAGLHDYAATLARLERHTEGRDQ